MRTEYVVESSGGGVRIDRYLRGIFSGITQSLIERMLRTGGILLNGKKVKSSFRLNESDILSVLNAEKIIVGRNEERIVDCEPLLSIIRSGIIYEDESVVIINKPAGVSVQGGNKIGGATICDLLDKILEGEVCYIVHRLDACTSGALVLARNLIVARSLSLKFRNREIKKEYLAVTNGVPPSRNGEIDLPIYYKKNNYKRGETIVAKAANTSFSVVSLSQNNAIVLLRPTTGRKHQLRIHMSQIGCPILGDKKYDSGSAAQHLHLHALSVAFDLDGREISAQAPVPDYMKEGIEAIFGNVSFLQI